MSHLPQCNQSFSSSVDVRNHAAGDAYCPISRLGSGSIATFDELIVRAGIVVEPFDELLVDIAFDAFRKYGKGQGGSAQLNIVDCAAYALARSRNLPLLFKGSDFSHTDIRSALPPSI